MRKVAKATTVAGLAVLALAGGLPLALGATGQNGSPSVVVVNPTNSPVPVTGTVRVGNLPATQPVSGTVNVGNLPAQPVPWGDSAIGTADAGTPGFNVSMTLTRPVVIDNVSFEAKGFSTTPAVFVACVESSNHAISVYVPLTKATGWGGTEFYVGTLTDLHFQCGSALQSYIEGVSNGEEKLLRFSVSGSEA